MTDPNYFDGAELRLEAATKPRRWCKCGHIEATHWGIDGVRYGISFQCHAKECTCTEFRPKRKWFKR